MSKIKKEKDIKTLDDEIQLVQMEKFINDFDTAMKKDLKTRLKKLALGIGPLTLSLIGYLIFKNPLIITIGAGLTGVSGVTIMTKDFINDVKNMSPKNNNFQNISSINEEKDVDHILQEGIGKSIGKDFYTEEYKSQLEKMENHVETEQEKKYREALEKQQMIDSSSKIKLVTNSEEPLNKDETMIQIVKEIDAYAIAYNIPPIEIPNHQWDIFFDSVYELFMNKGIKSKFYELMSQVARFTISETLLKKVSKISINNFIDSLCYLECEEITEKEISNLQKEILDKLPTAKIIDFSSYVSSGMRK